MAHAEGTRGWLSFPKLVERPATVDDAATLADLFNTVEVAAGGHPYTTESDQRSALNGWITDVGAQLAGAGHAGRHLGRVRRTGPTAAGRDQGRHAGAVLPEWRGKGIGRSLMSWQLERAARRTRSSPRHRAGSSAPVASTATSPGIRLLNRFGFRPVRYFIDMQAAAEPGTSRSRPTA